MLPICMVTEETLAQVPEDVRLYLRALRRRIIELESTDPQQRIAELEAVNRGLQVELDAALALNAQQQEQLQQLQQQLADAKVKLNTNSSNSSLPPSSDRFRVKRRPPAPPEQPRTSSGGQPGHARQQRLLVPADQVREMSSAPKCWRSQRLKWVQELPPPQRGNDPREGRDPCPHSNPPPAPRTPTRRPAPRR